MRKTDKAHRRPNLATIVGSGLAVVAAGSLLAFSSLAEQAGLEGLATRGVQPATPGRTGGAPRAIRIPAPPSDPSTGSGRPIETVLRVAGTRVFSEPPTFAPLPPPAEEEPERVEKEKKDKKAKPDRPKPRKDRDDDEPLVLAKKATDGDEWDGGSYDDDKVKKPKKPKKPHPGKGPKKPASDAPVYARSSADEDEGKHSKPPKMKKLEKTPPGHEKHEKSNGKGKGHEKHEKSNGKGKGHDKHEHSNGNGKGHSKH